MARENSCLSRIAAVGGALGGVVGDVFGTYEATIFKVPGGWAYEAKVLRPTNYVQLGGIRSIPIPSCWPLYTLSTISVKFVPCNSW
ncbi:hypothetical protein IGI04_003992 [Brassica rapa subsp. trilocularis]|uniref:Uncharacterized protein n=1 Tax=Brassica rapa subsp. trilocularis TaxID=1813537 RepID=A0ABQ7P208_BRACM|nr:hypothetical protein IGI04_003992 [Brassica rapa subsp. trilocularis]